MKIEERGDRERKGWKPAGDGRRRGGAGRMEGHNTPNVPKFGNWESQDNVPYTAYFDQAQKGRTGGKMINPNVPEENPDMFRHISPPTQAAPPKTRTDPEVPKVRGAIRPTHERQVSREDGDFRQYTGSPACNDNSSRRNSGESAHHHNANRPVRQSAGSEHSIDRSPRHSVRQSARSEHSIDRSPLHPHYQAKVVRKGSASPGWEGKNSFDSSHGTPGRSRMKPGNRGDETPDRSAVVPKATGMRKTLNQPMGIPISSTKCGSKGSWRPVSHRLWVMSDLTLLQGSKTPTTMI
ncbi:hypothetical protein Vadar_030122 [Vaccinium darrowii]|uniref:Uncharacterized protein n=1 Tax=Vaccinium darrowii TaxID=229202 RepID=A0ACB7ZFH2_9ERIC|nr:hypothetical protein Vadar_030122 [Vaccinium darrowii]